MQRAPLPTPHFCPAAPSMALRSPPPPARAQNTHTLMPFWQGHRKSGVVRKWVLSPSTQNRPGSVPYHGQEVRGEGLRHTEPRNPHL